MEFKKFGSIDQFRNVIKQVHANSKYHEVPVPTLKFVGTTKLHGCVSKNTLITMADGSEEFISDIPIGASVMSYNESSNEVEFDIVKDIIIQDLEKSWVKLHFDDNSYLECTYDHPILTTDGWILAENLQPNHNIISIK